MTLPAGARDNERIVIKPIPIPYLQRLHEVRFGQLTLEHPLHAQLPSGWSPPTAGIPLAAEAALEAAASSGVAPLAMLGE